MLKPRKKVSKKEIKQDSLVTAYAKATSFYYENKKYIGYAVTGIVVIIIALFVYFKNRSANNEKAAAELGKIFSMYDQSAANPEQYKVVIDGAPERGIIGLKSIVENYGGTQSGELARFYLANAYYSLHQYEEALNQFENFDSGDKLLQASALAGEGACYEAKGEYQKAASAFEKAANKVANTAVTPDYLNSSARCYGLIGEKEKAVMLYKRIKKDYPASTYAREADRFIAQFSS